MSPLFFTLFVQNLCPGVVFSVTLKLYKSDNKQWRVIRILGICGGTNLLHGKWKLVLLILVMMISWKKQNCKSTSSIFYVCKVHSSVLCLTALDQFVMMTKKVRRWLLGKVDYKLIRICLLATPPSCQSLTTPGSLLVYITTNEPKYFQKCLCIYVCIAAAATIFHVMYAFL